MQGGLQEYSYLGNRRGYHVPEPDDPDDFTASEGLLDLQVLGLDEGAPPYYAFHGIISQFLDQYRG